MAFGWGLDDVTGSNSLRYVISPVRNTWWQIAVVHSGTNVTFYKNGLAVKNKVMVQLPINYSAIWLGRFQPVPTGNENTWPWIGGVDDVRMYNRALSQTEISQLYAIESAPLISIQKAVYLTSSNLWTGSNYVVQASTDLINWTNQGTTFTATSNYWHSTNYWDVPNWNQLFFRLQLVP